MTLDSICIKIIMYEMNHSVLEEVKMKIHIIGGSGSGKTYLAKKLSAELNIAHYDLDDIQWDNNAKIYGVKRNPDERHAMLQEIPILMRQIL